MIPPLKSLASIHCRLPWLVARAAAAITLAVALVAARAAEAAGRSRPNVVVILADDQGWGDLGAHGNTNILTPNLDSLAADGALFERFYVSPVCSPTRAEFLTGRYHLRGGVRDTSAGRERLNLDEGTIAQAFKAAGYATGAFGKWHNGSQYPYHPCGRGFDEFYGFTSGHWHTYFDAPLEHNGVRVQGRGYIVDDFTDRALAFIATNRDRPFFCYIPYNTPHSPMQVPDAFFDRVKERPLSLRAGGPEEEDVAFTRSALAMVENIDWNVGRLLRRLDELRLAEDTIVLYFSDNGPKLARWNGGFKGLKGSTDEGGIRVPCLIRWPGRIGSGKRVRQMAAAIDLLPTLADLAGISLPTPKLLDGTSLKPLLQDDAGKWPDRMVFSRNGGRVSVRTEQYLLDHAGALFDLSCDAFQTTDISAKAPEIRNRLAEAVVRWRAELQPDRSDTRPFPVGFREFPIADLPARDGMPHGSIKRSEGARNTSFFRNWTSTDDRITWDIEVENAGVYEAIVYYTCPEQDIGSTIELAFRDQRLQATLKVAHDPPLQGAEVDRVRRFEGYMKDFRHFSLGLIRLPAGRGELTLRALQIPGTQVMDLESVVLRLLHGAQSPAIRVQ